MLDDIIRSYMYTQYNDDDNLRAFFTAYNSMAQGIYDWMVNANLPIFIGDYNTGDQLRWIAHSIYGVLPPVISSSDQQEIGPYNTFEFNQLAFNEYRVIDQSNQVVVSDDLFKRIMTWNFYKGMASISPSHDKAACSAVPVGSKWHRHPQRPAMEYLDPVCGWRYRDIHL